MARLGWVLLVTVAIASALYAQARLDRGSAGDAALATQVAQMPRGGFGEWGQMSEAERAKAREQMLERMLEQTGLSDKEKAAVRKTIKAKQEAREALQAELTKLRRTANKSNATEKELKNALSAYRAAVAQYRRKIAAEDAALAKQLSLKGEVRCLSLGILDNGLGGPGPMGMMGGPRPGGMGPGMPGMPGR